MTETLSLPLWAEIVVGCLLLTSGALALIGAWGMTRLKSFFQRMHPPALAATGGVWAVSIACIIYFSVTTPQFSPQSWLIMVVMAITAPITTVLLARAALFRKRQMNEPVPPPLKPATWDTPNN